jgi:hypothetical protein
MNATSNTRLRLTTQVGQAHAATGMLLDLGANFQPHRPENAAEHKTDLHRSGRWAPPVRPVPAGQTWRLPQNYSTPVRPVKHTGQTVQARKPQNTE